MFLPIKYSFSLQANHQRFLLASTDAGIFNLVNTVYNSLIGLGKVG